MEQEQKQDPIIDYPASITRVQSNAIDGVLMLGSMFLFIGNNEIIPGWGKAIFFIGCWCIYEPLCTAYGTTLGKYIMGIRVRKADDYSLKISLKNAFLRVFVKAFFGALSSLTIHFNPRRRALHDLAADSIVLEVEQIPK